MLSSAFLALQPRSILAEELGVGEAIVPLRHSVNSETGREMLALYAKAVGMMRQLPLTDTRSWDFQWYIHAVPRDPGKSAAIRNAFGNTRSSARRLATEIWSSCEPHFSNRSDLFLPWHRYLLVAFEDVIRDILGEPKFALPYWDYTVPGQRAIPEPFRQDAGVAWKELFLGNRRQNVFIDINAGDPMDKGATRSPYTLKVMEREEYGGRLGFCATIDRTLHGSVHTGVGDSTNMGTVPTAAGDPLFWLHHCNIDRIWAGWNKSGGKNPTFNHDFIFAAANGDRLKYDGSEIQDTAALGYDYDEVPTIERPDEVGVTAVGESASTVSSSAQPIQLGATQTSVPLSAEQSEIEIGVASGSDARFFVVLKGLSTNIDPGTLYDVFIDLPAAAGPDERSKHHVGTFGFFGTEGAHAHGLGPSFEITESIRELGESGVLKPESVITIEAVASPNADAKPSISQIELIAR